MPTYTPGRAEMNLPETSLPEQQIRFDLAACCRLMDLYGLPDLTSTHVSASIPKEAEPF